MKNSLPFVLTWCSECTNGYKLWQCCRERSSEARGKLAEASMQEGIAMPTASAEADIRSRERQAGPFTVKVLDAKPKFTPSGKKRYCVHHLQRSLHVIGFQQKSYKVWIIILVRASQQEGLVSVPGVFDAIRPPMQNTESLFILQWRPKNMPVSDCMDLASGEAMRCCIQFVAASFAHIRRSGPKCNADICHTYEIPLYAA